MSTNLYADTDRLSLSKVRQNWQHWRNTRRSTGKVPDDFGNKPMIYLITMINGQCVKRLAFHLPK